MMFECASWNSINDLIDQFLKFSKRDTEYTPIEIERKWIVNNSIIEYLNNNNSAILISHKTMVQGYLSVDPEIRYRSVKSIKTNNIINYISYKSDGELIREEYEYEIPLAMTLKIAKLIREDKYIRKVNNSKFIQKDYYVFKINDVRYQVSIVDNGKFTYMEVEFDTAEEATSFKLPIEFSKYIIKEVTDDSSYKMKNYWAKTRLNK